jgi:glycosyltransferase involved in cell wall biosynthesis
MPQNGWRITILKQFQEEKSNKTTESDNRQPLISILVPVYNALEYLPDCMKSIFDQTHKNLEIILINDGSTDGSGEMCDMYGRSDSRVKVIHQENAGWCAARNVALDIAAGEWIGFVDSDDTIEPQMFEVLLVVADEHKKQISGCGYLEHKQQGDAITYVYPQMPPVMNAMLYFSYRHFGISPGMYWCKIYHSSLFKGEGAMRFDPMCRQAGDQLFEAQIILAADGSAYVPQALYNYYRREGSITISPLTEKNLTKLYTFERMIEVFRPTLPKIADRMKFKYAQAVVEFIWRALAYGKQSYEFLPMLRKKARQHARDYLTDKEPGLKQKAIYIAAIICPKPVYKFRRFRKRLRMKFKRNG